MDTISIDHTYATTRVLKTLSDFDEYLDWLKLKHGPISPDPRTTGIYNGFDKFKLLEIYNGFIVFKGGVAIGVAPRDTVYTRARLPPSLHAYMQALEAWHRALWDWYDKWGGRPLTNDEIGEALDTLPEPPRPG